MNKIRRIFTNKKIINATYNISVVGIFTTLENEKVIDQIADDSISEETGWTRLKKMFSHNKNGMPSAQINLVAEASMSSLFFGFTIGGINYGKEAYLKFIEQNKLTGFPNPFEAKRKLQDKILLAFFKGGWKLGWRLCFFSTSLLLIVTSLTEYRGYLSVPEFTLAGAASGGLYKFSKGPKPMVAGAIGGGILGTVGGAIIVGLLRLTGTTIQDIYMYDEDRIETYTKNKLEAREKLREKLDPNLMYRKTESELPDDT